jgi:hypothetical protein
MKIILFFIIISVSSLINSYPINADVYTDSDLEQYKSSGDSNDYKQTERESAEDDKQYSPGDNKSKHKKTNKKFTTRGCEVVKFSQYNRTMSSQIKQKGRVIQGDTVLDEDESVTVHTKTKRCASFTIRNTSYSSKRSPIIKAKSAHGKTITKRISIPKLDQNKTHSDTLCFEELKTPIVKLDCSF